MIAAVWFHLKPVMVIWYGAHLAGMFALFLERLQGASWQRACIIAAIVACIAGELLAILALWATRYPEPQVVEHVHTVKREGERVTDTAPTFAELPADDGYQSIVRYAPAIQWPAVRYDRLIRAFYIILRDGELSVSVDSLKEARMREDEVASLRGWFQRRGLGEDYRRGIRLTGAWRDEITYLLPHLQELVHSRK
jgi:hypothetical protein